MLELGLLEEQLAQTKLQLEHLRQRDGQGDGGRAWIWRQHRQEYFRGRV
jgi:hypothetical protein